MVKLAKILVGGSDYTVDKIAYFDGDNVTLNWIISNDKIKRQQRNCTLEMFDDVKKSSVKTLRELKRKGLVDYSMLDYNADNGSGGCIVDIDVEKLDDKLRKELKRIGFEIVE